MIEDNGDPLNPASAAYHPEQPTGADLIFEERERQQRVGFTAFNDDGHTEGELIECAERIVAGVRQDMGGTFRFGVVWPGQRAAYIRRKYAADPVRQLVKAGALIAAEIDRLIRKQQAAGQSATPEADL